MDRIPKPDNDNPFAGFINMCRDLDNNYPRIEIHNISMGKGPISVGSGGTLQGTGGSGGTGNVLTVVGGEGKKIDYSIPGMNDTMEEIDRNQII